MIDESALPKLQVYIGELGVDGWLLFDFRGSNPMMTAVVGSDVVGSRRAFVYIPRSGIPTAVVHGIDGELWRGWPAAWEKQVWVQREDLRRALTVLIDGKTVATEYSPNGAIPYLDTLPAGMSEFLRSCGATLVSSGELVTRYLSVWTQAGLDSHLRAAALVAKTARGAFALAGERARTQNPLTEYEATEWILSQFASAKGFVTSGSPSVSFGANAARTHYRAPQRGSSPIVAGSLLLIDLWASEENGIYADQTWMAAIGKPNTKSQHVWDVVMQARDATLDLLRARIKSEDPVTGAEADRAAKAVIASHGFGEYIMSRTGHSIDRYGMHGYGPAIDDTESFDDRLLIPGVGFSVEPGVYIPGEIGVRSEVNAIMQTDGLVVTPLDYQRELLVV